jgi:hypothetical protein
MCIQIWAREGPRSARCGASTASRPRRLRTFRSLAACRPRKSPPISGQCRPQAARVDVECIPRRSSGEMSSGTTMRVESFALCHDLPGLPEIDRAANRTGQAVAQSLGANRGKLEHSDAHTASFPGRSHLRPLIYLATHMLCPSSGGHPPFLRGERLAPHSRSLPRKDGFPDKPGTGQGRALDVHSDPRFAESSSYVALPR